MNEKSQQKSQTSRDDPRIRRLTRVVLWIGIASATPIALLAVYFLFLIMEKGEPATLKLQLEYVFQFAIAVVTSVLGAITFHFFYVGKVQDEINNVVASDAAQSAATAAKEEVSKGVESFFRTRFDYILPRTVYPKDLKPQPGFEAHFTDLMEHSGNFMFWASSGPFATYRLASQASKIRQKQIRLLLSDPRDIRSLRARSQIEAAAKGVTLSNSEIEKGIERRRIDCFVTLIALYDISNLVTKIDVAFKAEQSFFRAEIFDHGLFLTYWIEGEHSDTYFYEPGQLNYEAYRWSFIQHHDNADFHILYRDMDEDAFKEKLKAVGCDLELETLRARKEDRYEHFRQKPASYEHGRSIRHG